MRRFAVAFLFCTVVLLSACTFTGKADSNLEASDTGTPISPTVPIDTPTSKLPSPTSAETVSPASDIDSFLASVKDSTTGQFLSIEKGYLIYEPTMNTIYQFTYTEEPVVIEGLEQTLITYRISDYYTGEAMSSIDYSAGDYVLEQTKERGLCFVDMDGDGSLDIHVLHGLTVSAEVHKHWLWSNTNRAWIHLPDMDNLWDPEYHTAYDTNEHYISTLATTLSYNHIDVYRINEEKLQQLASFQENIVQEYHEDSEADYYCTYQLQVLSENMELAMVRDFEEIQYPQTQSYFSEGTRNQALQVIEPYLQYQGASLVSWSPDTNEIKTLYRFQSQNIDGELLPGEDTLVFHQHLRPSYETPESFDYYNYFQGTISLKDKPLHLNVDSGHPSSTSLHRTHQSLQINQNESVMILKESSVDGSLGFSLVHQTSDGKELHRYQLPFVPRLADSVYYDYLARMIRIDGTDVFVSGYINDSQFATYRISLNTGEMTTFLDTADKQIVPELVTGFNEPELLVYCNRSVNNAEIIPDEYRYDVISFDGNLIGSVMLPRQFYYRTEIHYNPVKNALYFIYIPELASMDTYRCLILDLQTGAIEDYNDFSLAADRTCGFTRNGELIAIMEH